MYNVWFIMEKHYKHGWFGGTSISGNLQNCLEDKQSKGKAQLFHGIHFHFSLCHLFNLRRASLGGWYSAQLPI